MAAKKSSTEAGTTATSTKVTKSTTTRKPAVKKIKVSLHAPGELPEEQQVSAGMTLKEFNLQGYEVSVNGSSVKDDYVLQNGDKIRYGVKTKNA